MGQCDAISLFIIRMIDLKACLQLLVKTAIAYSYRHMPLSFKLETIQYRDLHSQSQLFRQKSFNCKSMLKDTWREKWSKFEIAFFTIIPKKTVFV